MNCLLRIVAGLLVLGSSQSASAGPVLYDGGLGTLPGAQGWLYVTNPVLNAKTVQSFTDDASQVDSTADENEQAGYFASLHPQLPVLDRLAGFTIRADLQLLSEQHSSQHRAGLSLIVLAIDTWGIELGFWTDQVWAQSSNPLFRRAESAAFDTSAGRTTFDLTILGDSYSLAAGGTEILTGPLRNYSAFGLPYTAPNFVFVGDNTSSARGKFQLGLVEVLDLPTKLVGDANGDCTVGAADYALWAAQFGQSGAGLTADFDHSGSVGAGDYALWAANFGKTCAPPAAARVPEPGALHLALVALTALPLVGRKLGRRSTPGARCSRPSDSSR